MIEGIGLHGAANYKALPAAGEVTSDGPRELMTPELQDYFDALYHRVEMTGVLSDKIPHLIGVTGCKHNAGATTVSAGLAATAARQGKGKVLFIQADTEPGRSASVFGVLTTSSLVDLLEDGKDRSAQVSEELHVLSASRVSGGRPISMGRRFRELVDFLKDSNYATGSLRAHDA